MGNVFEELIHIGDLDKAEVLKILFDNAKPHGLGKLAYTFEPMEIEDAKALLKEYDYFDYLYGRVLKVDLGGDFLEPWLYDRDNGIGKCKMLINRLRGGKQ